MNAAETVIDVATESSARSILEPRPVQPIVMRARDEVTGVAMMLERAIAEGFDLDRLERLIALQKKVLDDRAMRAFAEAMAAMQSTLTPVPKRHFAQLNGWGFYYADLGDMTRHCAPFFAPHGLSYRWHQVYIKADDLFEVTCTAMHRGGHSEQAMYPSPVDRSINTKIDANKQNGIAVTVGMRRSFGLVLGITTEEDVSLQPAGDRSTARRERPESPSAPRSTSGEQRAPSAGGGGVMTINDKQRRLVSVRLDQSGIPERDLWARFNVGAIAEIPKSQMDNVLTWIAQLTPQP